MAKILIHIGAHKTATTSIQWTLRNNKELLEQQNNLNIILPEDFLQLHIRKHFRFLAQGFENDSAFNQSIELAKLSIKPLLDPNKLNVISYEGFMGHSDLREYGGIYRPIIGKSLKAIFSDDLLKVILTIRRQDEFINSCYLQQVKEAKNINFEDFTAGILPQNISWSRITNEIEKSLGEEKLLVMPMEYISHVGLLEFVSQMFEFYDKSIYQIDKNLKIFFRNKGLSKQGVDIYNLMRDNLKKADRRIISNFLFTHFSSAKFGKHSFFNEFQKNLIIQNCLEDNKKILSKSYKKLSRVSFIDAYKEVQSYYGL